MKHLLETTKAAEEEIAPQRRLVNAINEGNLEAVNMLILSRKVNLNHTDDMFNPVMRAILVKQYNPAVLALLLASGASATQPLKSGPTIYKPIHRACRIGNSDAIQQLFDAGAKVDECDSMGNPPLASTIGRQHEQAFEKLLSLGVSPEQKNSYGEDPIYSACSCENYSLPIINKLIERGVPLDNRSPDEGMTPLISAVKKGWIPVVSALIAAGANPEVSDRFGNNPLEWAEELKKFEIIRRLRQAIADKKAKPQEENVTMYNSRRSTASSAKRIQEKLDNTTNYYGNKLFIDRLKALVESEQVKFIHVLSLPRSRSHAVTRIIAQAPEVVGVVNEASFYADLQGRSHDYQYEENKLVRRVEKGYTIDPKLLSSDSTKANFEVYCQKLYHYTNELLAQSEQSRPAVVVLHDHINALTHDEISALHEIVETVVVPIREPRAQGLSLLTRRFNDMLSQPGGKKLTPDDVLFFCSKKFSELSKDEMMPHFGKNKGQLNPELIRQLVDAGSIEESAKQVVAQVIEKCVAEYAMIWDNISFYWSQHHADANVVMLNTDVLMDRPEAIMSSLFENHLTNIAFNPSSITCWDRTAGDKFIDCITKDWGAASMTNAWNGPAKQSAGLTKRNDAVSTTQMQRNLPSAYAGAQAAAISSFTELAAAAEKLSPKTEAGAKSTADVALSSH